MSERQEFRVEGLSEPVSHYTDAVRAGDLLFVNPGVVIPNIKAGKLRPIGFAGPRRLGTLSDVPTIIAASSPKSVLRGSQLPTTQALRKMVARLHSLCTSSSLWEIYKTAHPPAESLVSV